MRKLPLLALALFAACASGPEVKPDHEGPLSDAERDAFHLVLGVQDSLMQLCDYASFGLVVGALNAQGLAGLYQQRISPDLKLALDAKAPPYQGKATLTLVPSATEFMHETEQEHLKLQSGAHAFTRYYLYTLRFHADEDVSFPLWDITFARGTTLELPLRAVQAWDGGTPQFQLNYAAEKWTLPSGAVAGVSASGFFAYAHWFSPGAQEYFHGSSLDFKLPGALPAVELREQVQGKPALWIGDQPYGTWNFVTPVGGPIQHHDDFLRDLLNK